MGLIDKLTDIVKTNKTSDKWTTDPKMTEDGRLQVVPTPEFEIVDISDNVYLLNRSGRICVGMLPDSGYENKNLIALEWELEVMNLLLSILM